MHFPQLGPDLYCFYKKCSFEPPCPCLELDWRPFVPEPSSKQSRAHSSAPCFPAAERANVIVCHFPPTFSPVHCWAGGGLPVMSLSQSSKRPWKKNLHFLGVKTNFKLEHAFCQTSLKYCHRITHQDVLQVLFPSKQNFCYCISRIY